MRILGLALVLLLSTSVWAGPAETHSAKIKTSHFEVRYRPGSRAGAIAESVAAQAERALAWICDGLGVKNDGRYKLYLYDSVAELAAINKTTGVGGFANTNTIHTPIENIQTLTHEITHVVTYRLPKSGDEPRNMFFPDGIANALLEYVHGVPVHAVAKFYKVRKRLPPLREMAEHDDFYAWGRARPGLNAYDIAASWFRYLIDTYGMPKTLRYYTGTPAKDVFGAKLEKLERAWHEELDGFAMRPEVETLLKARHGEPATFTHFIKGSFARLPPDVRGKPQDWTPWAGESVAPVHAAQWKRTGEVLQGKTDAQEWSWCALGKRHFDDVVISATLEPAPRTLGVAIRLGEDVWTLLVQAGAFLFTAESKFVSANNDVRLGSPDAVELTLRRRGDQVEFFVDGTRVLKHALKSKGGRVMVGVAQGTVRVASLRVREL